MKAALVSAAAMNRVREVERESARERVRASEEVREGGRKREISNRKKSPLSRERERLSV